LGPFEIKYADLVFEKKVGKGSFGVVWKGISFMCKALFKSVFLLGKWRGGPVAISMLWSLPLFA
jgi:hypothetical protein